MATDEDLLFAPEHVTSALARCVAADWVAACVSGASQCVWRERLLVVGPRGGGKSSALQWLERRFDSGAVVRVDATRIADSVGGGDDDEAAPSAWLAATFARVESAARGGPVLFLIDNVDAVASRRRARDSGTRRVCVRFLAHLDALSTLHVGVVATTADVNACDAALLRHGRLARRVELRAPLPAHARAILQRRMQRLLVGARLAESAEVEALLDEAVVRSKGLVGAQLEQLVDNAALGALRVAGEFQLAPFAAALRAELPIVADVAVRDTAPPVLRGVDDLWRQLFVAVVEPLRDRPAYERLGIARTDGVLLHGPSGCGKSALVEALARAAALPLVTVRGPELIRAEIGASEQLVRRAFADARARAPCLLLIDQLDAIARSRDDENNASSEGTSARVLGCLLTEMDGLLRRDETTGFVVLATTNRLDLLDRAILRPGRFDLLLPVPFPERAAREAILRLHLGALHFSDDVARAELIDWAAAAVAAAAPLGCSSASLAAVAREAGMNSLRRHSLVNACVERQDVIDAAASMLQIRLKY